MQLFRDRNLNIAMLISASWHLVCIFSITPILISGGVKEHFTAISFLGSILERVVAVPERPLINTGRASLIQRIKRPRDIVDSGGFALRAPETVLKTLGVQPDKQGFTFSKDRDTAVISTGHYKAKQEFRLRFKDALVMGEARNRIALYRPDLPKVSAFPYYFSPEYSVTIRFKISRHGFVESPECIISSGSSEIDHVAMRYIRRWQFIPHDETMEDMQEGVIRINFDAK